MQMKTAKGILYGLSGSWHLTAPIHAAIVSISWRVIGTETTPVSRRRSIRKDFLEAVYHKISTIHLAYGIKSNSLD
jgi:hypothetical protein